MENMSLEQKNKNWRPTASSKNLQLRANILHIIREFFWSKKILEVETPLLCSTAALDPHLHVIKADAGYLQTSPEFAMKRLLSAGSDSIYQICRAFRLNEQGAFHNQEFTILEWYKTEYDHHQLMDEVDDLLRSILPLTKAKKISYKDLFKEHLALDPHIASIESLQECVANNNIQLSSDIRGSLEYNDWLDLLLTHIIEPKLIGDHAWMIYDYPASQAALAKIRDEEGIEIAERFEVYINGVELANGYHELQDSDEQLSRFKADQHQRSKMGLEVLPIDVKLINALEYGLPNCAGVALGIDRLVMLAASSTNINEVIAFPSSIA